MTAIVLGDAGILNISVLATLIFWGAWGVFDKLALKEAPPVLVLIAINCLAPLVPPLTYWAMMVDGQEVCLEPQVFFWTFLAGFSYFVSMVLYLWVLNKTEASLVLGLTSCYPVVLQFFSHFFLGEALVFERIVGSVFVAFGIVVMGLSARRLDREGSLNLSAGVWLAILGATLLWGVWGVFDKKAIELSSAFEVLFCKSIWDLVFVSVLSSMVAFTVFSKNRRVLKNFGSLFNLDKDAEGVEPGTFFSPLKTKSLMIPALMSSICLYAGGLTYLLALSRATASYVIVITGCYPLVMYIFALVILKERFNRTRLIGIILITIGALLTQVTSSC